MGYRQVCLGRAGFSLLLNFIWIQLRGSVHLVKISATCHTNKYLPAHLTDESVSVGQSQTAS